MVGIFTGSGTGYERGSGALLRGSGLLGSSTLGRGGEQVFLNASNGNLLISRQDEFLVGRGPDAAISRTYNSLATYGDDNGDHWQQSTDRRLFAFTGTINTLGSAAKRRSADGSEVSYVFDGSAYVNSQRSGADDHFIFNGTGCVWTDGTTGATETYEIDPYHANEARLVSEKDLSGNTLTFAYSANKLTSITTADGGQVQYGWSGDNIVSIVTSSQGMTQTRTRYSYDGLDRLSSVSVDLTPDDNSIADGNQYTTSYTYQGASKLVASVSQTDGSRVDFTYDGYGRVTGVTQSVSGGVGRTTLFGYGPGYTFVTDPAGQETQIEYNPDGSLHKIIEPAPFYSAYSKVVSFTYTASGEVATVTNTATGPAGVEVTVTSYEYDANGNTNKQTDTLNNVVTRKYGANNELLTETRTGSDTSSAAAAHTTRYVYDAAGRLRFEISAEGNVRGYAYNLAGQIQWTVDYAGDRYDLTGMAADAAPSEAAMTAWDASLPDKSSRIVVETHYDARGNISEKISYGAVNSDGTPSTANGQTRELFTYDQAGQLVNRSTASVPVGAPSPTYGLSRLLGRFGGSGGAEAVSKTFALNPAVSGTSVEFDFVKIDSWDGEAFVVHVNGAAAFSFHPEAFGPGQDSASGTFTLGSVTGTYTVVSSGTDYSMGFGLWGDSERVYRVKMEVQGAGSSLDLGFGSTLDEAVGNESFGIDNVKVSQAAFVDNFANGSPTGWAFHGDPAPVTAGTSGADGGITAFLGRFGSTGAGEAVSKDFTLNPGRTRTSAEFDLIKADSWDGEQFTAYVNGLAAFSFTPEFNLPGGADGASGTFLVGGLSGSYTITSSGQDQALGFAPQWADRVYSVRVELNGTGSSLRLGFGSTLDEAAENEAFGIDNVRIAQPAYAQDFEDGLPSGWVVYGGPAPVAGANGAFTSQLGQIAGSGGAEAISKTFALDPALARTAIDFDFNKLDSWDGHDGDGTPGDEKLFVFINGAAAFSFMPPGFTQGQNNATGTFLLGGTSGTYTITSSGYDEQLGFSYADWGGDRVYRVHVELNGAGSSLRLGFGSTTDGPAWEESFGIDNVQVSQQAFDAMEDFEGGSAPGWIRADGTAAPVAAGGSGPDGNISGFLGQFGPYGNVDGAALVSKTFALNPALSDTSIDFDFLKIDSWDGEQFFVHINGSQAFAFQPESYGPGGADSADGVFAIGGVSGTYRITSRDEDQSLAFNAQWPDRAYRVHIDLKGTGPSVKLGFGSTLSGELWEESFGIDNVKVAQAAAVADFSFEVPEVGSGYSYNPAIPGVQFRSNAGVAGNGSAWGFAAAPDGDQVAFLRSAADGTGSIVQSVTNLTPGATYRISFLAAQRAGYASNPVTVRYNGIDLGTFTPQTTAFTKFTTIEFQADGTAGTIEFVGVPSTLDAGTGIDRVQILQQAFAKDDFEGGSASGWTTAAGAGGLVGGIGERFDTVLGPVGGGGTEAVWKNFTLNPALNRTSVEFDFLKFDSWDGEQLTVYVGGTAAFSFAPEGFGGGIDNASGTFSLGGLTGRYSVTSSGDDRQLGVSTWADRPYHVRIELNGTGSSVKLGFGSSLDGVIGEESFGIDNVRLSQPLPADTFENGLPSGWVLNLGAAPLSGDPRASGPVLSDRQTFLYDGMGRIIASTDLDGGSTSILFNDAAGQTVVTLASGLVTTSTYNRAGELISVGRSGDFSADGSTSYAYDQLGRLRMATDATGLNSYFLYDRIGRKIADVNHNGDLIEYRYDQSDRPIVTVRYANRVSAANLAALANPSSVLDAAAIRPASSTADIWTWQAYDTEGRVVETIDGDGTVATFEYDSSDRLVKTTSYANKLSAAEVANAKGWNTTSQVVLPLASSSEDSYARNFYDKDGRLVAALDGAGYLTRTVYDAAGRKVQQVAYANATVPVDRASATLEQLLAGVVASGQDRVSRFVYDGQNLLRFAIDGLGQVTEFGYEATSASWTATGVVRQTIRYAGALGPLSAYDFASVRAAINAAGLATNPGNRTDYAVYDAADRLLYAINAQGGVTGFSYDLMGRVTKTVDYATVRPTSWLPTQVEMEYWTASAGSSQDRVTRTYYDEAGEPRFTVDPENYVTRNDYDAEGRIVRTTRWSDPVAVTDATTIFTLASLASGPSVESSYLYDAAGRLAWAADGEGNYTSYAYFANGTLASETVMAGQPDESRVAYEYDAAGRVSAERRADGAAEQATTHYGYDGHGNLITVTDPRNNTTTRVYDHVGQLISETDAENGTVIYEYDAFGQVVRSRDARLNSSYSYYDKLGRLTTSVDAENYVTQTGYTIFGEVASVTRRANAASTPAVGTSPVVAAHANDATTQFDYDRLGRLVKATDAMAAFEEYTLDAFGNRVVVRNKLGGLTANSFDRRGLLVAETLPMASVNSAGTAVATTVTNRFEYDGRGNRTKMIEADGLAEQRTTIYVYDKLDRLVETRGDAVSWVDQINYLAQAPAVPTDRIKYDTRGNVVELIDANGARTLFFYDKLNRKTAEINALGTLSTFTYDKNGNVEASRVYATAVPLPLNPGGVAPLPPAGDYRETGYTYDKLDRLKTSSIANVRTGAWNSVTSEYLTGTQTITTHYDYDAAGNLVATTDPNGGIVYRYYDKRNIQSAEVDQNGYVTGWLHDAEGNVVQERRWWLPAVSAGPSSVTAAAFNTLDRVTDFAYDRNGRRTVEVRRGVEAFVVNDYNQKLQTPTDAVVTYAYNALGQVTQKTEATGEAVNYDYDNAGRLTRESRSWIYSNDYAWVRPTVDYRYDGLSNLTATRQGGEGTTAERITSYSYTAGGRLHQMTDAASGVTTYWQDRAGNQLAQTWDRADSGAVVHHEGLFFTRDLLGRETSQSLGTLAGTAWAKGDIQSTSYNGYGEVAARAVNGGIGGVAQERFVYDNAGRLSRSNAGDGVWRHYVYDAAGHATLTLETEGRTDILDVGTDVVLAAATLNGTQKVGQSLVDGLNATIAVFDKRGQAVQTILPKRELGGAAALADLVSSRGYNAFGEVAFEQDARDNRTDYAYNNMGRLTLKQGPQVDWTDATGATILASASTRPTEKFFYDLAGRMVDSEDANGNQTLRVLLEGSGYGGAEAQAKREIHADGGIVAYQYDVFGDMRWRRDEVLRAQLFSYDGQGRLTFEHHANGLDESYGYDARGQRLSHTDNVHLDAETTDYDLQGRVVAARAFGGDTVATAYAWNNALASGLGATGGWTATTTYINGRTASESTDQFGHQLAKTDLGGHNWTMSYDAAGRMTGRAGQDNATYAWLNTGLVGGVTSDPSNYAAYSYDAAGNRLTELTVKNGATVQNAAASYDALGRLLTWSEAGSTGTPAASIAYQYDKAGNIRRSYSTFFSLSQTGAVSYSGIQDNWYAFDNMNRVTIAKGALVNGAIERGALGTDYLYDAAGQRVRATQTVTATAEVANPIYEPGQPRDPWTPYEGSIQDPDIEISYQAARQESYAYDAGGALAAVRAEQSGFIDNLDGTVTVTALTGTGLLKASYVSDLLGRTTHQTDWLGNGVNAGYDRAVVFNARGQVASETVTSKQGSDTLTSVVTNQYGTGAGYALGAMVGSATADTRVSGGTTTTSSSTTTNVMAWWDGAVTSSSSYVKTAGGTTTTDVSSYSYGASGTLDSVTVGGAVPYTVTFTNDLNGQALRRDRGAVGTIGPHELWYRFGGRQLGYLGNNGTQDTDYTTSIAARIAAPGTGAFRNGAAGGSSYADFDQSLSAINSYGAGGSGGSYEVRGGDTLAGIAAQLWGDSALWYKLAEANGLGANSALVEGQRLTVPSGVMKNTHNAGTFKPYDPSEVIGDLGPAPNPQSANKKNKCGAFGAVLLVAVAVAVTVATAGAAVAALSPTIGSIGSGISAFLGATTGLGAGALVGVGAVAGAAGSIASQGVGLATGLQEKFSWSAVAISALSSAVSGGIGKVGFLRGASGVGGIAQSVGRGVISSAAVQGIGVATGLQGKFDWAGVAAAGASSAAIGAVRLPGFGGALLSGTAGAVAGGAARSLIDGSSFGDNVLAALPDVIGQTIGNAIAGQFASSGRIVGVEAANRRIQFAQNVDPSVRSDWEPPEGYYADVVGGVSTPDQGPVWRGMDGHYILHSDGSSETYYSNPQSIYSQNSLSLLISYAQGAADRHQAQVAYAYRQINAYEADHPGSFARWGAERAARQAHVDAALAGFDGTFTAPFRAVGRGAQWLYENTIAPGTAWDQAVTRPFWNGVGAIGDALDPGAMMAIEQAAAGTPYTAPGAVAAWGLGKVGQVLRGLRALALEGSAVARAAESARRVIIATERGVAMTPELLSLQGTSKIVGDFRGIDGARVEEIISRVPENWTLTSQERGMGIRFFDDTGMERLRLHGPGARAPAGSNSASGWTARVAVPGRPDFYYDNLGNIVGFRANEGHIPIYGNPKASN